MKIGIMSMQKIPNLGSFLQAYGLKKMVEDLGHNVEFVDIPCGLEYNNDIYITDKKDKNILVDKINKMFYLKNIKKYKKKHFSYFNGEYKVYLEKYLNVKNNLSNNNNNNKYDCLIVGSDEVFNCLNYSQGFTTAPFGSYKNTKKTISYAASCGWTKIEFLKEEQKLQICEALKKMNAISVRDNNTKYFISKLTNKTIELHLDPVLVSSFEDLFDNDERIIKDKYILIYGYYNRICNLKHIKAIKKIAKKNKYKIIALGAPQYWCDDYITVDPKYIINVFKNAEFIVTDTFHGTILSIKAKNKFVTLLRKSNNNKLKYLLENLNLSSQIINDYNDFEKKLQKDINFEQVEALIEEEKQKSIKYLKNNI